jgi:Chaperone of endosialidase
MTVPYNFATATGNIPLAQLDANFAYYDAAFSVSGTTITLLGGTANGVPYLNASKQLITGAALTYNGTTFKVAGQLYVNSDANYIAMVNAADSIYYGRISQSGSDIEFYNRQSGALKFGVADAEQMRLTSTGNLLVGTTSQLDSGSICLQKSGAASNGIVIKDTNAGGGNQIKFLNSSGTTVGYINQNGTLTIYSTTSDQRLKENIIDAPEFGSVIDLIQVRSYDWKENKTHQRAGFIAQELVAVAPEAVCSPENPDEMMAVDYSKLVPMLVKEIQSLRKRLAAAGI